MKYLYRDLGKHLPGRPDQKYRNKVSLLTTHSENVAGASYFYTIAFPSVLVLVSPALSSPFYWYPAGGP